MVVDVLVLAGDLGKEIHEVIFTLWNTNAADPDKQFSTPAGKVELYKALLAAVDRLWLISRRHCRLSFKKNEPAATEPNPFFKSDALVKEWTTVQHIMKVAEQDRGQAEAMAAEYVLLDEFSRVYLVLQEAFKGIMDAMTTMKPTIKDGHVESVALVFPPSEYVKPAMRQQSLLGELLDENEEVASSFRCSLRHIEEEHKKLEKDPTVNPPGQQQGKQPTASAAPAKKGFLRALFG